MPTMAWIAVLYFAQGLPFGVFMDAVPVYLRLHGTGLVEIGLVSLLQVPWSLKVLWSPLVDRWRSLRFWISASLLVLAGVHAAMAAALLPFAMLLGLLVLASATQDIAIDAAFVRSVPREQHGLGNGVRVTAYRVAMIVGGGFTVMLAPALGWGTIWSLLGIAFVGLALVFVRMPGASQAAAPEAAPYLAGFWAWVRRPLMLPVFGFVLLFKLGDASMGPMVRPFWVDRGMTPEEIGFVTTTVGILASIGGAMLGGWFVQRRGIVSALIWLGGAQALSNLVYATVAWHDGGRVGLYTASIVESATAGLGTAALLSLLTRACDPVHAAAQYALLSAIFGLTRTLAGGLSGLGAVQLGYPAFFALTCALAVPAYLLLPWVKRFVDAPDRFPLHS